MELPTSEGDGPALTPEAADVLHAALDLFTRCGASAFNYGYLHDDVPVQDAGWYAYVEFKGARITVEQQPGPIEAFNALAARLLDGSVCTTCTRIATTDPNGVVVTSTVEVHSGRKVSQQEASANVRRNGACHWVRDGQKWYAGCDPHVRPKPRAPEGDDELHSTEKLARALEKLDDPARYHMADRARLGYYDTFLGPLTFAQLELIKDLRELGMLELAERVMNDEFDESAAESAAWAQSADGQAVFAELDASGKRDEVYAGLDNFARALGSLSPERKAALDQKARQIALSYGTTTDRSKAARAKRQKKGKKGKK